MTNAEIKLEYLKTDLKRLNEDRAYYEAQLYQVNAMLAVKTAEYNRLYQEQIAGQKTLFQDPQEVNVVQELDLTKVAI